MVAKRKSIADCDAYATLERYAKNPVDLTRGGTLTTERVSDFCSHGQIFDLLYGTQQVDDDVLAALQLLADQCGLVEQFAEMRKGATLNRIDSFESENRQVLHTACRDLFSNTPMYPPATAQAVTELKKLETFLVELEQGNLRGTTGKRFDTLIHVGIGGSDLGPRSIYEALRAFTNRQRQVFFISNVDPDDSAAVLEGLDLSRCLVLVVSKSGTTQETLANESIVRNALIVAGMDPAAHCIAVTGESSPMDNPERYLRSFYMYDYIGGRYSATSMVGAVTLGFAIGKQNLMAFLEGANSIDEAALEKDIRNNIPLLLALLGIWNHNFLAKSSLAVLPYSQPLHRFPAHLQQCDMESNGKSVQRNGAAVVTKTGPTVWGEPGTNGQHAFYQLLHQGTEDVAVEFIGFRKSQREEDCVVEGSSSQQKLVANMLAQSLAFATGKLDENPNKVFPGNRVSSILIADRLTPKTMGALLALYEAKIVFQGFCWNINSFDQEGVQLGKKLAAEILAAMGKKDGKSDLPGAFLAAARMES